MDRALPPPVMSRCAVRGVLRNRLLLHGRPYDAVMYSPVAAGMSVCQFVRARRPGRLLFINLHEGQAGLCSPGAERPGVGPLRVA